MSRPHLVIIAAVASLAALAAGAYAVVTRASGAARTAPSEVAITASVRPTPTVSVQAWCRQLGPHLTEASDVITEFVEHPDGTTLTYGEVSAVADKLGRDEDTAPESGLRILIGAVREPFLEIQQVMTGAPNRTIPLEGYRDASVDLIFRCGSGS